MFCIQCGSPVDEDARFCPQCGQPPVSPMSTPAPAIIPPANDSNVSVPEDSAWMPTPIPSPAAPPAGVTAEDTRPPVSAPPPVGSAPPPQKRPSKLPLILSAVLLVAVCVGGFFAYRVISNNNAYRAEMRAGSAFMDAEEYGQAISSYLGALDLKPGNADATCALARAYLCDGQSGEAENTLGQLDLPESSSAYEEFQTLVTLSQLNPEIGELDASTFPLVTVKLDYTGDVVLTQEAFKVSEGGVAREIQSVQVQGGTALISYVTEDTDADTEQRNFALSVIVDGVNFTQAGGYQTPHFEPAQLDLVSTDVSQYPLVKAYFRVADSATGATIENLGSGSFTIGERTQGGEYLVREVKSVSPLEGYAGLNIDLAADKSDSIDPADMQKIKKVMIEFANNLHFSVGDKAEILAFDSIVQQMCYYTSDLNLLINGINNMSTDGMTALYDAIYAGVDHAALQGGARCVIAFTDGMDNVSLHSASEVSAYASTKQVPVYIIGVSSMVEESTLRTIAESTGGRYWFIDDLYDLQEIFNRIYTEQKELYVVEYESDSAVDRYLPRDLSVKVSGGGHRSSADLSFAPVRTINDGDAAGLRTARYQLLKESLSWEAASQKCQEMGGHLATITSQAEMDELVKLAESSGVKYLWLGGYTSHDEYGAVFGHWVTGEEFTYQAWSNDEPSRIDQDNTEEWYVMLWNIPSLGGWTWNDQRNDPAAVVPPMADGMAYICEFET